MMRPYRIMLLPNYQQQNQIGQCNLHKEELYNFTYNLFMHLFRNYGWFLKDHNVKSKSEFMKKLERHLLTKNYKKIQLSVYHVSDKAKLLKQLKKSDCVKRPCSDYRRWISRTFFPSYQDTRNWFNHVYLKLPRLFQCYTWSDDLSFFKNKDVPAHTRLHGIADAVQAFQRWHKHIAKKPRPKGNYSRCNIYFDGSVKVNEDQVKLPKFDWMQMAEGHYAPSSSELKKYGYKYTKAYAGIENDRFYVTVISNEPLPTQLFSRRKLHNRLGIDVGLDSEATINLVRHNGERIFRNYSKDKKYQRLVKGVQDASRKMSRCPSSFRGQQSKAVKNDKHKKRTSYDYTGGYLKARKLHSKRARRARNYLHGKLRAAALEMVKMKPKSITIENLNIKGMMQNHKLARAIARAGWGYFYKWLAWFCVKHGIQLRRVSRWFASTKECCHCHYQNLVQLGGPGLDLGARILHCPYCGLIINRDLNAAINLAYCSKYQVWKLNKHGEYQWI